MLIQNRTGLVPSDSEGALGVREADLRARQREVDFFLLLQRVVVSSEQELIQNNYGDENMK